MHKTARDIAGMKNSQKISVLTSYDYTLASLCDGAGIDVLLVGDSAGMVMLGHESTVRVTMEHMCMFTNAASQGRSGSMIVGDLPFMSYQASVADAIKNAGRLVRSGADAVKLEGGESMAETIKRIVGVGIPVMGHIGLQPQTATLSGGYRIQGKTADSALKLIRDAKALEDAGAFSIILEMVTQEVAQIITDSVNIPTIGIGSGAGCDGQVLVVQDLLGLYGKIRPKFAKRYLELSNEIIQAVGEYKKDVEMGRFPGEENSFSMDADELEKLRENIGKI